MSGPRLTVYLTNPVADRLELASVRKRSSKSALVNEALDRMLNAQRDETNEAGMARRLDRMAKQFASYERNQSVVLESLAMFIRYYLTLTAPTPKAEQDAARIIGNQRFETFVAQVGKRIAGGISSMGEAMEKASVQEPDQKQRDPDKSLLEETRNAH
jgi:predicted transcriptional regulator